MTHLRTVKPPYDHPFWDWPKICCLLGSVVGGGVDCELKTDGASYKLQAQPMIKLSYKITFNLHSLTLVVFPSSSFRVLHLLFSSD